MRRSLAEMERCFPGQPIRIGAQTYLNEFYKSFGFVNVSEVYMEDGIEHVEMVRTL
jgi:ElaA protein